MARLTLALSWGVPTVLCAAALYEAALALGASGVGSEPGSGAPGEWVVRLAALLAMLAGCLVAGFAIRSGRRLALALTAPAAAAFVVARLFTYDPYYAPSARRYADGNGDAVAYSFVLLGVAALSAILSLRNPRLGAGMTVVVLIAALVASFLMGAH